MHQRHSPCALADFAAGDVRHGSIKRVASAGRTVMATASILDEDGHATSLGKLGLFANKDGALAFAVRCTTAFIDGDDMPLPPFQLSSQRGAPAFRRLAGTRATLPTDERRFHQRRAEYRAGTSARYTDGHVSCAGRGL